MATGDLIKKVMRAPDDYYGMLGVDKQADEATIKKAYKRLALQLHPDKCQEPGAEEAFKKVAEAVEVLGNPQKRARYDQFGVEALREGGGGGHGHGPVSAEEIFQAFFGGPGGATFMAGPGGMGGMGGGFHSVRFSSGGPGGVQYMHFSSGGGGARMRRGAAAAREARQREEEEEEERGETPDWLRHVQLIASALGPLLPFVVLAMFFLMLTLMGRILQFIMSRGVIIFPILYLAEGRMKLVLLASVVFLAMFGVL